MGLFKRLMAAFTEPPRAATQAIGGGETISTPEELAEAIRGQLQSSSGTVVTTTTAMRVAAVYRCNAIISGVVANLPLDLIRRVGDNREDAKDHPLWEVLTRQPNGWQTPQEFRRLLQTHVNFLGNGYALIVRSRRRILEIIPLDPTRMSPKQADDLSIEYHYQRKVGGTINIHHTDIMHLRGLSMGGIVGNSIIGHAREAIGLSMATEMHGSTVFKNGAAPAGVLEHPGHLGAEGVEFLKASLEEFRGASNANKTMILEEGMKFNPVAMTSTDAQYIETRKHQIAEIAMFFGIPPHMLGASDGKSSNWGTGIEQQSIGFVTYTLNDWLTMWEQVISRDLIDASETDLDAKFNRNALLRGDTKARSDFYVKMLTWGVFNPDIVLALEDMNPRADGQGGVYYDPPNTAGTPATENREDDDENSQSTDD